MEDLEKELNHYCNICKKITKHVYTTKLSQIEKRIFDEMNCQVSNFVDAYRCDVCNKDILPLTNFEVKELQEKYKLSLANLPLLF